MSRPFQARVADWVAATFGRRCLMDQNERIQRFVEEALELGQAVGLSVTAAHDLVSYVYGRPTGEIYQEVGGVMNTLAAVCESQYISMDTAGDNELIRCWQNQDKIRAKHAQKPKLDGGKDYSQPPPRVATQAPPTDPRSADEPWWHWGQKTGYNPCCSAITPCSTQQRDPYAVCDSCREAKALPRVPEQRAVTSDRMEAAARLGGRAED